MGKRILDATCGSRMIWFNKQHQDVVYMDNRQLSTTLCDGRVLNINPDVVADFRDMPEAVSIRGATPMVDREMMIDRFKAGEVKTLISKPDVLGFGLNLQVATRQIFSSLIDSYEQYYQAVKRSNRYGSTVPLNVHIPVMDIELPMADNVLRKAALVAKDTAEQESLFRSIGRLDMKA